MDETLNDSVDALLRTYSADGGINYLDAAATLPSRPAIDAACVELLSLLFPGFHGEPVIQPGDLPELTRSRIRSLRTRLRSGNVQKPCPAKAATARSNLKPIAS